MNSKDNSGTATNTAHDFTGEPDRRAEQDRRRQHYSDQARIAALEAALRMCEQELTQTRILHFGNDIPGPVQIRVRELLDGHTP